MLPSCSSAGKNKAAALSFSDKHDIEELNSFDGESVTITGYMSTRLPSSGNYFYLKNLPYQSCPFCVPNTAQLANTIAVYAKPGDVFEFTDRAIRVTGVLEFGNYTDEFGYEYNYRIKDAEYAVPDTDDLDPQIKLWQQLASTDVVAEIYRMYEYVSFLCFWPTYTAQFEERSDYLYPSDISPFYQIDGAQYNYGYQPGYFDSIITTVEGVSSTDFTVLIENIRKSEALASEAIAELEAGRYTAVTEYSSVYGDGRTQYKMDKADEFEARMQATYQEFAAWLATWEI